MADLSTFEQYYKLADALIEQATKAVFELIDRVREQTPAPRRRKNTKAC